MNTKTSAAAATTLLNADDPLIDMRHHRLHKHDRQVVLQTDC
jgi:hypothetical protein